MAAPKILSRVISFAFQTTTEAGLQLKQKTSTALTKIVEFFDNSDNSVFSVTREGFYSGCHSYSPDVVANNTLATAGTLTLTAGKDYFPVVGTPGAVTGCLLPTGSKDGQIITLKGTHNTNTVTFSVNGGSNILGLNGGTTRALALGDIWQLHWDGIETKWIEDFFRH